MHDNISTEFAGLNLGDSRLDRRAAAVISRFHAKPQESFPNIFSPKELEGFYRFVGNPWVTSEALLQPHILATVNRAEGCSEVIIAHDTSEFIFSGKRQDLDAAIKKDATSFHGHFSLALESRSKQPLGVLKMHHWVRGPVSPSSIIKTLGLSKIDVREMPSEMDRWFDSISETSTLFSEPRRLIHVCDSESDDYELFADLLENNHRFVIRACHNRRIADCSEKLWEVLSRQPILAEKTVPLSKRPQARGTTNRRNLGRAERVARLSVRYGQVELKRPTSAHPNLPASVLINAVYVLEIDTPEGCKPVDWMLITSDPITNKDEALHIIDTYCARWLIEEYFKALKTGCSYEARQLESYETLTNCLSLFVPIAWLMLKLRHQSRQTSAMPAWEVLPSAYQEVLELEIGRSMKDARDVMLSIARLGGHIKNNGDPGWLILWRGYRELVTLTRGYLLARKVSELNLDKKM